ncbi:cell elongation-specific peptidoglycan biosynthesis regulator RodA [Halopolyspora algeriensis]|uniref:Cell elongation-specific peptidoglycan biosynthesis regulator RodA n=1 Tax=Halopolyspora algeriensis TaxID=1500506 RepID=A0A368VZ22_9ACTN|nr:FtsW/RodA/SpoVE family cell cycle protein [Halopolyspora algeriensis]RCW47257.1 cell elongation-specific peptidoglycan biosynthesis regulator RodA [Halopolyspora algeriensis]TQM42493.1 cell elongation-specific peptidoglycan biosynthesis regulator RodA [Halopolyspora algeriensis]
MSQPVATDGADRTSGDAAPAPQGSIRRGTELLMLIFAAVVVTAALVLVAINQHAQLTPQILYYGGAFLALFGLAHLAVRRWAPYSDPLILPLVAFINGLGLVIIHRVDLGNATEGVEDWTPAAPDQVLYTAIALVLFVLVLVFVRDHRTLAKYGYTCGLVGLVALAAPAVLPSAIAPTINGAKLWIYIGPLSFQPAEFAKLLLLIFFAAFLVSKRELFTTAGRRFLGIDFPRARDLAPVLVAWTLSIGIVVLERDLGTSLLFFGIVLVMIYIATERAVWIAIGLSLFAAGCFVAYPLFGHVQERVGAWLNPLSQYQLREALFGMATGGLFGSGLGGGRPAIVPHAETDFVLASVAEELGLLGLAALFMVYLLLMARGLRSSLAVRDSFGKLLAGGLSFAMALQVFVVAGGVTGLIPLTGLTTPFLAAGGSSLLANYMLIALLLRISDAARRPQAPSKPKPKQAPIAEAHTELVERPR